MSTSLAVIEKFDIFWTALVVAVFMSASAHASGDPKVNLPRFFEYAFISQIMSAAEINAAQVADSTKRFESASRPNRRQELLGLRRKKSLGVDERLGCSNFDLVSYSQFLVTFGEDAFYESFIDWAKPAQAIIQFK